MKSLRLLVCIASGSLVASGVFLGCGGDDTIVSGTDSGIDASKVDGSTPDGGGIDGSTFDSGGGTDSGTDAADAGSISIAQLTAQIANTECTRVEACCNSIDAGATFNKAKCITQDTSNGWQGSSQDYADLVGSLDGGTPTTVKADPTNAAACISAVSLVPCSVTAALSTDVLRKCANALSGTQAIGQACNFTVECTQPAYCQHVDGGAAGTCQPLVANGGNCSNVLGDPASYVTAGRGNDACSRRSTGVPGSYCDNIGPPPTFTIKSVDQWTCQPVKALGAPCAFNAECASEICDPNQTLCTDPLVLNNALGCTN